VPHAENETKRDDGEEGGHYFGGLQVEPAPDSGGIQCLPVCRQGARARNVAQYFL